MSRFGTRLALIVLLAGVAVVAASTFARRHYGKSDAALNIQQPNAPAEAVVPTLRETTSEIMVQQGDTWTDVLDELELPPDTAQKITAAAQKVFNFRQLKPGSKLTITHSPDGSLQALSFSAAFDRELRIVPSGGEFVAEMKDVPSTVETIGIGGEVQGSLFLSVMDAGERPELAMRLAEIFAWDLDFYTDPRPGDTFKVIIEKKLYENGATPTYGRILAAEYDNSGRKFTALLFHDEAGRPAYYDVNGNSLQKAFLRSPLKFAARISSHYSRNRFHPVLKIFRPHLGTDYAAPTGTPVQSIARGRVVFSGYQGGGGNIVHVQHSHGFETYYMHLSKRLVRAGQTVSQGQRIGLVGATGLATGSHLDFRLRRNGAFVNFERMKLPPDQPVRRRDLAAFTAERDRWLPAILALLPGKRETEIERAPAQVASPAGNPAHNSVAHSASPAK